MSGEEKILTSSAYISHHLTHWQVPLGGGTLNLDTVLLSLILGCGIIAGLWMAARRMRMRKPGRHQVAVEMLVLFVRDQVKGAAVAPEIEAMVGSLALTVFAWVLAMNGMDLIPVDTLPVAFSFIGVGYFRPVPTADMNMTFALAIGVVMCSEFLVFYQNGFRRGLWGLMTHPFGLFLAPFNVLKHLIGTFSRVISLALRLFGNMYGGELIFILIAGLVPYYFQWLPYWLWLGLHLLIVTLQAFIFMVLSVIYISMAKHSDAAH